MGKADEIAIWGARGDGKSWAVLWGMILHALEHQRRGFALPVTWLALRDTFSNHEQSTHKSLLEPGWDGRWSLHKGGHVAEYAIEGVVFVRLEFVGADQPSDAEKVRTQCHCVWAEEVAAAMEVSAGIPIDLWLQACASARLPTTHANVACLSSNMPDEGDAYWQRFEVERAEGTLSFVVPAGERASPEYRARLARIYASRPDLARRLLHAKPGTLVLGSLCAEGFNEDLHVKRAVPPMPDEPIVIGLDGGLTPTSVILQRDGPLFRCIGALHTEHGGMRQHVKWLLRPWLSEHVPWVLHEPGMIRVAYDPSIDKDGEGDSDTNALKVMRELLPAIYRPGPVNWDKAPSRRDPLLAVLNGLYNGQPLLTIDSVQARGVVVACRGGWHYKNGPDGRPLRSEPVKNHPHSDYGDGLCYALAEMQPSRADRKPQTQTKANTDYDYFNYHRGQPKRAITGLR